jgi:hypothetical protein
MAHFVTGPNHLGVNLERCDATAQYPLGLVVEGRQGDGTHASYRYVQFLDAVAYVAGQVVTIASATTWAVSNDRSGGSALAGLMPVGVVFQTTVPTQNQYGWVQISGIANVTVGSASVIAGDYLKVDASEDGEADEGAAGTDENLVGIALATIADNATGRVMLTIRGA